VLNKNKTIPKEYFIEKQNTSLLHSAVVRVDNKYSPLNPLERAHCGDNQHGKVVSMGPKITPQEACGCTNSTIC
jgi:hypothetical protein